MSKKRSDQAVLAQLAAKLAAQLWSKRELRNMRDQFSEAQSPLNQARVAMLDDALGKTEKAKPMAAPVEDNDEVDVKSLGMEEYIALKYLQTLRNARGRNIDCTLSIADVGSLLSCTECYYSGLPFAQSSGELALTFDRVDNKRGYVPGNVVACISKINRLKNQLIEQEGAPFKDAPELLLKIVAKWVKQQ